MNRLLVVGIGSLIMTDDGIGTKVAEALESKLREYNIRVLKGETDYQYCFDEIQQDDFLVVIDAMAQGKEPGSIEIIPIRDALKERVKIQTQHDFSLFDAVLFNYPYIKGYLIGVEAAEIEFGLELSAPLKLVFDKICSNVFEKILEWKESAEHA